MTITFAQIDKARNRARRGLAITSPGILAVTMYDDDMRREAADMYLHKVHSETVAGHRRFTYYGDLAQVDSYIQAVIGALT